MAEDKGTCAREKIACSQYCRNHLEEKRGRRGQSDVLRGCDKNQRVWCCCLAEQLEFVQLGMSRRAPSNRPTFPGSSSTLGLFAECWELVGWGCSINHRPAYNTTCATRVWTDTMSQCVWGGGWIGGGGVVVVGELCWTCWGVWVGVQDV